MNSTGTRAKPIMKYIALSLALFTELTFACAAEAAPLTASISLTNGNLELRWQTSSNYDSKVETAPGVRGPWSRLWLPFAAPLADDWATNVATPTNSFQLFRVRYEYLTNSPVPTAPGVHSRLFVSGRVVRSYLLNIPNNYTNTVPAPLAFILHGHEQTAASFAALHPDLAAAAQSAGMILVFPQSTDDEHGTGWNNFDPALGEHYVDDAQFILELLEYLDTAFYIDRQRVFVAGFSNGGQMVHYLAARTTNTFAAYAAVAASIGGSKGGTNIVYVAPPLEPNSILIVNATNDCGRPFWGGINDNGSLQPAALEAVDHWTSNNICLNAPIVVTNFYVINSTNRPNFDRDCPDFHPAPNVLLTNYVLRTTWLGCTSWVEVAFVELTDGGHLWPDAKDYVGFDANAEVIKFFVRHCRCDHPSPLVIPTAPGTYELALCDQGYRRIFRLAVPTNYTGVAATPLVFLFHGGEQNIEDFSAQHPALYGKCNTEGVILVMPQALDHPATSETLWGNKPFDRVADDNAFVTNLLATLDVFNLDPKRIYATGFSGGGSFSYYLGMTTTNLLAAIAPVCTMVGWDEQTNIAVLVTPPPALEPIPVLMVRGTLDTRRPYNGGLSDTGNMCYSANDDFNYWVTNNLCTGIITTTALATNITEIVNGVCSGTTEVRLVRVGGMPHLWPDASDGFNYNANVSVIDFLLTHARP
jgi:polyhydroxybutyrate depolymerase